MSTWIRWVLVPSGFVAFAINSILGAFVLLKNPRSPLHRFFAIFAFSTACWSIGSSLDNVIVDEGLALRVLRGCYFSAAWLPTCFLHFVFVLTGKAAQQRRWLRLAYVISAIFAALALTPLFIPRLRIIVPYDFQISEPGPAYGVFVLFFTVCLGSGLALLAQRLRNTTGHERRQTQYILIAFLIAFSAGIEYFSRVFRLLEFPPLDDYILVVYFLVFAYAIVRHQLLDIRVVLRKSLVYSLLVACLTAVYLVMVLIMEHWFAGFFGYRSFVASVLVAVVIALGFTPLHDWLQALVDRALFQATLAELADQRERLLREVRRSEQQKLVATLAAGLAHEIKNPLTAIKTFTEFLPEKRGDAAFIEQFHRIVGGEVVRINALVQRLLDFARPVPPKLAAVDLSALLDHTLESLSHELVQKRITVQRQDAPSALVRADSQQLTQVLLNLLLNSLHAMDGAGGTLTLTTRQQDQMLALTIADTGCGISPEHLARIGEPFFTTKTHGTGLGLAVVQSILQEHGGSLQIESAVGRGTTVIIALPIIQSNAY